MQRNHFINYAHRGASSYAPENTMEAFHLGIGMGANGIETDVQRTKDGILVLFHDDTILRMTGKPGKIQDYTYDELLTMPVSNYGLSGRIPRLEEFLEAFAHLDLQFAIEFKEAFTEQQTIDLLDRFQMQEKTVLTSFKLECLMRAKLYAPQYKAGYLTDDVNPMVIKVLKTMGVEQVCPKGKLITPDLVEQLHGEGFSVRPWGVKSEVRMQAIYDAGVDGMTVNFPDKLTAYMA
ncbi:MAG: hypothetical protein IKW10_03900 [Oscillospiraceae bacterium]|nr:hypothetical protein [Oscillospiraceae bacterium]